MNKYRTGQIVRHQGAPALITCSERGRYRIRPGIGDPEIWIEEHELQDSELSLARPRERGYWPKRGGAGRSIQ